MRRFPVLFFIFFTIIINWNCTKIECPPQPYITVLSGSQIIHSEVHSISPTTNYSTSGRLAIWSLTDSNVPDTARSYLQFDYSSIPSGATIISATLSLYADTAQIEAGQKGYCVLSGPNNWYIIKLNSAWQASSITWDNAPTADTGGAINIIADTMAYQTYNIDLTNLVKDEYSNPSSNYGIELRLAKESYWRGLAFYSPEGPSGLQPTLLIEYTK